GVKMWAPGRRGWIDAVDRLDAQEAPVLLRFLGRASDPADPVAGPQAEAANLARTDLDVIGAGHQAGAPQQARAIVDEVEDARRIDLAGTLDLALQDRFDEVLAPHVAGVEDVQIAAHLDEFLDVHVFEFVDIHRGVRDASGGTGGLTTRPGERAGCFAGVMTRDARPR